MRKFLATLLLALLAVTTAVFGLTSCLGPKESGKTSESDKPNESTSVETPEESGSEPGESGSESTTTTYTITWMNGETELGTTEVEENELPVYEGETPTKEATAQYTYTFSGWAPKIVAATENATYTATFTGTVNTYTVTWKNGDDVIETDENVEYGDTPEYNGATPTKEATAQYTYTFSGWTPEIVAATEDATYTATFDQTVNNYTITWKNGDDTIRTDADIPYGTDTPSAPSVEEKADKITIWYPSPAATVTENVEYNLVYKPLNYAGEIWDFTDSSIVKNDVKQSAERSYYVDYFDNYDGESGVVAVTNTLNDWNWDVWFLSGYTAFADSISAEADTLFIKLKASAANVKITLFGGGADAGASLVLYEYVIPTDWTTVAITGERFTAFKTYLAHYRGAFQAWMQNVGTVYISDVYVGKSETVANNNSSLVFGEVTINDDSATVFSGYTKLVCEVKAPDNTLVTVTDGKFVPTDNGAYTVNYYALMPSGVIKTGSYAITCLEKNDLGTFVPSASDWHQQGGSSYTATVVDNYAEHIINVDTAAYTSFVTLRAYMTANSKTTVKIRFDFISGGKISIGKQNGGSTAFEFGDTDGSGRAFASGSYYEMELNMLEYERVYCQIIWQACEFYVTYEFVT